MKVLIIAALALAGLQLSTPASADLGDRGCSTRMLAGRWIFATGIGHQQLVPPASDITAIGTMNIHRDGTLGGDFDVTFEAVPQAVPPSAGAFVPDISYSGTVQLNADCTGTITFTTAIGTSRTDSIALVEKDEIWAMSQDPNNLWTYRVRRISRSLR